MPIIHIVKEEFYITGPVKVGISYSLSIVRPDYCFMTTVLQYVVG